ncbi:TPA: conjugal transfer protein, partial [Clostridioides difficile]
MFKKNKKPTENIKEPKEKKVRTVKVGTHKKTVIALWVVLIASVSFGVYKNFAAIDMHTVHETETIQLRLNDTSGIENFVKNFGKSYYTWNNSKEAIEARTQAISNYLTKELQDLNVDTIRTDIPTSSTVTDVLVWNIEQLGT